MMKKVVSLNIFSYTIKEETENDGPQKAVKTSFLLMIECQFALTMRKELGL